MVSSWVPRSRYRSFSPSVSRNILLHNLCLRFLWAMLGLSRSRSDAPRLEGRQFSFDGRPIARHSKLKNRDARLIVAEFFSGLKKFSCLFDPRKSGAAFGVDGLHTKSWINLFVISFGNVKSWKSECCVPKLTNIFSSRDRMIQIDSASPPYSQYLEIEPSCRPSPPSLRSIAQNHRPP